MRKEKGKAFMKKIVGSLPFKLVLGVVIGILVGQVANEGVMNVVVTIKYILNPVSYTHLMQVVLFI